jgi:hypothetical protein
MRDWLYSRGATLLRLAVPASQIKIAFRVTRNASQSHSCRYGEKSLDTFCRDNGGDSGLGYLAAASGRHPTVCPCDSSVHSPPFGISVSHHLHRLSEIRPTVTRPIQRLCDILNVLLMGRKIPHSGGAVKRTNPAGAQRETVECGSMYHATAPFAFRSCSNRANAA